MENCQIRPVEHDCCGRLLGLSLEDQIFNVFYGVFKTLPKLNFPPHGDRWSFLLSSIVNLGDDSFFHVPGSAHSIRASDKKSDHFHNITVSFLREV